MSSSAIKYPKRLFSQTGGDASLPGRVTNLENNEYKITYYEIISGTSGSITLPTGATINAGEFGLSGNAVLSKIDGSNKPTFQSPVTSGGIIVTASLNESTGAWVASGTYTDANVALIYSIKIKAINYGNLTYDNIIETINNIVFYKKAVLNIVTSGTTSSTSITLLTSGLIPANTVQVGSKLRMVAKFYKTGSLGQGRTRFYINTSNTLTGATLLATQGLSTGNFFALSRTPEVKSATNTELPLTTLSLSGDEGGVVAMASMSSININWTVDQYIIAAGECANAGDSMTCQSLEVLYL